MTRRADLPTTGPTGNAAQRQQRAIDMLRERDAAKARAAARDPGADTSREIANRAKREWATGASKDQHGPNQ
jgi:hypothetical protein